MFMKMSDEIITTDYGFGVVQINKTNNNDKIEEIGVSNYLLADNDILSRKVKSLEHENKVLKRTIYNCVRDILELIDEEFGERDGVTQYAIEQNIKRQIEQAEKEVAKDES